MRTSVPGICNPLLRPAGPALHARGFTLIELLVVLVIMGIALGIVTVNLLPDDATRLRRAGEQLALLLENAGMEARSSGVAMAWVGKRNEYLFLQRNEEGQWESVESGPYRARAFEQGITIAALELDGKPVDLGSRLVLSASSFNVPFNIRLAAGPSILYVAGDGAGTVSVILDRDANALAAK